MNTIGLKRVTFYLIRHKETKRVMPLAKRNRGYSHWNPGSNDVMLDIFLEIPRLLESRKQAQRCIDMWFAFPNGKQSFYQSNDGEYDDIIDFKSDERKKEDLEIIKIRMVKM